MLWSRKGKKNNKERSYTEKQFLQDFVYCLDRTVNGACMVIWEMAFGNLEAGERDTKQGSVCIGCPIWDTR